MTLSKDVDLFLVRHYDKDGESIISIDSCAASARSGWRYQAALQLRSLEVGYDPLQVIAVNTMNQQQRLFAIFLWQQYIINTLLTGRFGKQCIGLNHRRFVDLAGCHSRQWNARERHTISRKQNGHSGIRYLKSLQMSFKDGGCWQTRGFVQLLWRNGDELPDEKLSVP